MNILTKATVLVLNRNWQAINVRTPQEAFCMMATNVATGLEIEGEACEDRYCSDHARKMHGANITSGRSGGLVQFSLREGVEGN